MERPFPAYRGDDDYIFVSYAHSDASLVYPELVRLNEAGFNVWYDEGISPGAVWRDELARAIQDCSTFILFVTGGVNASEHVMKEVNFALETHRRFLAVHLQKVDLAPGLRLSVSDRQGILAYESARVDYQAAIQSLISGSPYDSPSKRVYATAKRRALTLAAGGIVVVATAIGWMTLQQTDQAASKASAVPTALSDTPALAVLPLTNLGGDEEDEYFVDALSEDLLDRFASFRTFPVIGWLSARTYRNTNLDLKEVGRELSARYLITGSVQRSNNSVRVNVRSYDAESGTQISSESYVGAIHDVLDFQEQVTTTIVPRMYPEIEDIERRRAMRQEPEDMSGWDLAQKGYWYFLNGSREDNLKSQQAYRAALDQAPRYAYAWAGLALTHYQSIGFGFTTDPERDIDELVDAASQAVQLNKFDALSQHALGHAHALQGNRQGMIDAFTASLELNPSSALVQLCAGEGLAMAGESKKAIEHLEIAARLSPRDPQIHYLYHSLALAYFGTGEYDEAVRQARRALNYKPRFAFGWRTLATSLAHAGRLEEARDALHSAVELEPEFSLGGGRRLVLSGTPEIAARYIEGLREAGYEDSASAY